MIGRPEKTEAAPYYFTYIDRVSGDDPMPVLESQWEELSPLLSAISEEKSLYRYAPEKWSIRQLLNHVTDTERAFAFRALWFARGFESPLPSYDQDIAASAAQADRVTYEAGPRTNVLVDWTDQYVNDSYSNWLVANGYLSGWLDQFNPGGTNFGRIKPWWNKSRFDSR